ncbi:MAG: TIGR04222 domain-containing membrane protein [Acidobacteriota bacterium]|nr:TIGR04222 domain-containing membrane protein [Acidobacteriota bacterium]
MDFLFDNPLASMYGPYFLVFYSIFIISTVIGYRLLRSRLDKTAHFAVPPIPHNPDPFEIAFLRGGANELARAVVFSLAQKNLLEFANSDKTSQINPTGIQFDLRTLSPIERTTLGWFGITRDAKEIFHLKDGLTQTLKPYYETFQNRLEMQNFFPNEEMKRRNNLLMVKAFLIFGGLGAYKFIAALSSGFTNIIVIVVITVIGMFVLGIAAKMPRLTKLGKQYLERLQMAFDRIKPSNYNETSVQTKVPSATFAAFDPFLLSVGVFGGAVLAGTIYSDYNRTFEKAQSQASLSSSSCGSGCGSSSCSSSGSSGGCGGCGGGCS